MGEISRVVPPATLGVNYVDDEADMDPAYARALVNLLPKGGTLKNRTGAAVAAQIPATLPVETLVAHNNTDGSHQLIAAVGAQLFVLDYDGDTGLLSLDAAKTKYLSMLGDASGRWVSAHFAGRTYLCSDVVATPQVFDGTSFSDIGFTLPGGSPDALTDFTCVAAYKTRVYWATPENIYYGPSSGVTGTLSAPFNATEFFQKGGGILWIGSHTTNTGQGLLDYFVVVSTEGEILCYAGTSPESSTWSLASRFIIGKPAGPRAFLNYEADLLIVSENGLISLNRLINKAEDVSKYGSKIGPYMSALSSTMPSHYWQPVAFPEEEILLVNTHNEALVEAGFGGTLTGGVSPYVATPQYGYLKPTYWNDSSYNYSTQQLVMVNQTGSTAKKWTVFQGWESFCYAAIGRHLYYGSIGGLVCRAFYTGADMGKDIPLFMSCSFNYFKNKMQVKRFTGVRPLWNTSGRIRYGWGLEADYRNVPSDAARDLGVGTNGFTFPFLFPIQFGTEMRHYSNRYSVKGNGRAGSVRFFGQGRNINIEISAIHVFFETGGVL